METKTLFEELVSSNVETIAFCLAGAYMAGFKVAFTTVFGNNLSLSDSDSSRMMDEVYKQYIDELNTKSSTYIGKVD